MKNKYLRQSFDSLYICWNFVRVMKVILYTNETSIFSLHLLPDKSNNIRNKQPRSCYIYVTAQYPELHRAIPIHHPLPLHHLESQKTISEKINRTLVRDKTQWGARTPNSKTKKPAHLIRNALWFFLSLSRARKQQITRHHEIQP